MTGISPLRFRQLIKAKRRWIGKRKRSLPFREIIYRYPFKIELRLKVLTQKISKHFVDRF